MRKHKASTERDRPDERRYTNTPQRAPAPVIDQLQHTAGNHAVSGLLARQPTGVAESPVDIEITEPMVIERPTALEALWRTNVAQRLETAHEAVNRKKFKDASASLDLALSSIHAVEGSYAETDPPLNHELRALYNGVTAMRIAVDGHRGLKEPLSEIQGGIEKMVDRSWQLSSSLH